MKRTSACRPTLATFVVLIAGGLAVSGPAHADVPTCDGKPATIVGPGPGNVIEGTPGDDVIVTVAEVSNGYNGAINTYEGDDTVCIVPGTGAVPHWEGSNAFTIRTGPGSDKVLNQEPRNTSDLVVFLGIGEDTFTGDDRNEQVWAGEPNRPPKGPWWHQTDDAQDIITTAGGKDIIITGTPSTANTDIISTGPGEDEITHAGTGTTIDNGPDSIGDAVTLDGTGWNQHVVTVDNTSKTATGDAGTLLRWTNLRVFKVHTDSPVRFVGSEQSEVLHMSSVPALPRSPRADIPIDVSLNGGNDNFWFYDGVTPGRVDGGTGTDVFAPDNGDGCLDVTATLNVSYTCTVALPGDNITYRVAVSGFETHGEFGASRSATITGTPGPDTIRVYAPRTTVHGLRGDDFIYADAEYPVRAYLRGDQGADRLIGGDGRDRLLGGRGNDKMSGRAGGDQLRGGMGTDIAKGGAGRDTCRAEKRRSCER